MGLVWLAVAGDAAAAGTERAPDVVVVLDATCSMSDAEIDEERAAAAAFVDCIEANGSPESRIAVTTFGGFDYVLQGMTPLEGDGLGQLQEAIAGFVSCRDGGAPCSNTNHAAGYGPALELLDAAATPPDVRQAIVFVSDGEPVVYSICRKRFISLEAQGVFLFDLHRHCAALPRGLVYNRHLREFVYGPLAPTVADYTAWVDGYRDDANARDIDTYPVFYGVNPDGEAFMADHVLAGPDAFMGVATLREEMTDRLLDVCHSWF